MRRVFLTGATGFIGSYVAKDLLRQNSEVAILIRPDSDRWRIKNLLALQAIDWDGKSVDSFAKSFTAFSPDTVYHLGWSGVGNMHRNELSQLTDNLNFAINLTRLSVDCGVQHFIGAGSQAEYGPANTIIDENTPTRPTTLYGAAKLSAGFLTERIAAMGGMRHSWLRIFSTYGAMDNSHWMLPSLIEKLLKRERPALTRAEQNWDFLHVTDASSAFLAVAATRATGTFNLGSGKTQPLRTIIETVRDLIDPSIPLGFGEIPYRPDQVMHLQADIKKLQQMTNWSPKVSLIDGLKDLLASMT